MRQTAMALLLSSLPILAASQSGSWEGAYGGLSLGGRWADTGWTTTSVAGFAVDPTTQRASLDGAAFRMGGFLGRNWAVGTGWLGGVEADLGYGNQRLSVAGIPGTHGPVIGSPTPAALANDRATVKLTWDASLRGRIGAMANPTTLVYVTGGIAWQRVESGASCTGVAGWCVAPRSESSGSWRPGWTLGVGAEGAATRGWTWRAEYRHARFQTHRVSFFPGTVDAVTADIKPRTNMIYVGLVQRF
jgi:outer membrane immunogenic protein